MQIALWVKPISRYAVALRMTFRDCTIQNGSPFPPAFYDRTLASGGVPYKYILNAAVGSLMR
jgi:hypothetical protein